MNNARPIRRALISVSDKTGIVEFAKALSTVASTFYRLVEPLAC